MSTFAPRRLDRVAVALFVAAVIGCAGDEAATAPRLVSKPHAIVGPTLLVTNTNDAGPGSLRQTLSAAATGSTIQFDPALAAKTITLTSGPLTAAPDEFTIEGPANGGVTVRPGAPFRILGVTGTAQRVVLRNLTLTGGSVDATEAGGAILWSGGGLTLDHVLISGNSAGSGGAIYVNNSKSDITLLNSTISGNTAATKGGAIHGFGKMVVRQSTIVNNTAGTDVGGIRGFGLLQFEHSIVANNTAPTNANCDISLADLVFVGTSLSNDDTCGTGPFMLIAGPMLGALAANGGPTNTHALLKGSPAIDAAPDCTVPDDQRYVSRPRGAACDMGAFEFNDYTTITLALDASMMVNSSTGVAVVSGTVQCSVPTSVPLEVTLWQEQKLRRVSTTVQGKDILTIACTGTQFWSVALTPASGGFEAGAATASVKTGQLDQWVLPHAASAGVKLYWGRK